MECSACKRVAVVTLAPSDLCSACWLASASTPSRATHDMLAWLDAHKPKVRR